MRLTMLLLLGCLALGIGLALAQTPAQTVQQQSADTPKSVAQTQEAAQPSGETPANTADKPAETPEVPAAAAEPAAAPADTDVAAGRTLSKMRTTTQAQRRAASAHAVERLGGRVGNPTTGRVSTFSGVLQRGNFVPSCNAPTGGANADYMGLCPNYAYSPVMRKFVDALPGLGAAQANALGNYIPIAVPTTNPYSGLTPASDYYEIGLQEYRQQLHSDMPNGTKLRGYADMGVGGDKKAHFLGPLIIARRDKPVRIKFTNNLPTGANGKLFLPVDTTIMGAGNDENGKPYLQSRANLHLHGGNTPWISDGTPHQWTVPFNETTTGIHMKGMSVVNVPDMADPGQGALTYYYTNQQSGRLMFYHDHSYGITRLNVYGGEAAGYLLTDSIEDDLITRNVIPGSAANTAPDLTTNVYAYGIPLIIQDKTFISGTASPATGTFASDPTWANFISGSVEGDLWFPHVYMPNQNPSENNGANAMGRWDYGPWFWPPQTSLTGGGMVPCPSSTNSKQMCPGTPNPSLVPESFLDTPLVNGTPYPYVALPAQPTRFRILNATNDRHLNLQLYVADPLAIAITNGGSGYTTAPTVTIAAAPGDTGAGAAATAIVSTGSVTSITGSGGAGYPDTVAVTITGGGGTGAAAIATVKSGTITGIQLTSGGSGYTTAPLVVIDPTGHTGTLSAAFTATITPAGSLAGITVTNPGLGYTLPPVVTIAAPTTGTNTATALASVNTEVKMVGSVPPTAGSALPSCGVEQSADAMYLAGNTTALPQYCWPGAWPTDGRDGGVPDPGTAGPAMIQIGTEGGLLPAPVVIPSTPVGYNYNRRDIVVLNVENKGLFMGPAERADVIVDLSNFANKTLILYNDAPAPVPGFDTRLDYYTGDVDQTSTGGAPTTLPGYGPNTRTIMQIRVGAAGTAPPFSLATLQAELPVAFAKTFPLDAASDHPIVPESAYNTVYGTQYTDTYARIQDTNLTFTPNGSTTPAAPMDLQPKAIHELFDTNYGRMNSVLGVELPLTNWLTQTTIPLMYIDPPTEVINDGETQIWKITHNGVDTHAVHFHLFNVQLLNRVGWDGAIRPPDPNELGFKETVRMNPLEDAIVALRPMKQNLPFGLPESTRPLDVTAKVGTTGQFTNIDPLTNNPVTVFNTVTNFGFEYVWHCHLLGHEENDMMRPIVFKVKPLAIPVLTGAASVSPNPNRVVLNWTYTNNAAPANATGFRVYRTQGTTTALIATLPLATLTFTDTAVVYATAYTYKVVAYNATGVSLPSNSVPVTTQTAATTKLASPSTLAAPAALITTNTVTLVWNGVTGATQYVVERALASAPTVWTQVGLPAVPTLRVTGLTTKTNYLFRVSASNGIPAAQSNPYPLTGLAVTTK
jgi:FtsP/CotA-like multicopper oxidase with cupredoxin domain